MTENEVLELATLENPIINKTGNKIEFKDGTTYAKDFRTGLYRKVKNYML
jgi:hypothetical protein